ncbi:hypothetical protein Nepgr_017489 [Nepenthes gracilis]|uniref:Uncharacterized protein n=1 Tax=Nepenthes gracilis TaxID=150966 RepID=A0AAD3SPH6_NEPGR|nr:hypothetical protein Nepgr_017489 [Nepenthes gracilis]
MLSLGVVTVLPVMLYAKMLKAVMLVRGFLMECKVQLIGAMHLVLWPSLFLQTLAAENLEKRLRSFGCYGSDCIDAGCGLLLEADAGNAETGSWWLADAGEKLLLMWVLW